MIKWWWTILIGIASAFIGYKLNQQANAQSEKRIIDALTAEIESLKTKKQTARLSSDESARLNAFEEALTLIKNK